MLVRNLGASKVHYGCLIHLMRASMAESSTIGTSKQIETHDHFLPIACSHWLAKKRQSNLQTQSLAMIAQQQACVDGHHTFRGKCELEIRLEMRDTAISVEKIL